jgi:hypothetical protein
MIALPDFQPLLTAYNVSSIPLSFSMKANKGSEEESLVFMKADYTFDDLLDMLEFNVFGKANVVIYNDIKAAVKQMIELGNRPTLMVFDWFADPCIGVAGLYKIPTVGAAHLMGRKGVCIFLCTNSQNTLLIHLYSNLIIYVCMYVLYKR